MKKAILKTLNNKPFNTFFFIDCLYNSLFTTLEYKNISIVPILLNSFIKFEEDKKTGMVLPKYLSYLSITVLLERMGAPINYRNNIRELLKDIDIGIENDIPTGVFVDCYDELIRKDTYHKLHNDHCILVIGHNERFVTVLEQSSINTLNYQAMQLSDKDLITASESFERNYIQKGKAEKYRYFQILQSQKDEKLYSELLCHYFTEILSNQKENSFSLVAFAQRIIDYLESDKVIDNDIIIHSTNEIINIYKMYKYLYQDLWQEIVSIIDDLLFNWIYMRMAIFRNMEGVSNKRDDLYRVYTKIANTEKILQNKLTFMAKYFCAEKNVNYNVGDLDI